MGQAPTVRVLNDVDEAIRELSVRGGWLSGGGYRCEYDNQLLRRFRNVRSIFANIAKKWFGDNDKRLPSQG